MAKLMSRLAVSHFFSLTDEAKRFVLSMLKNYDKPFMEICEAADVAPLTGGRIINGRPFNSVMRYIVEPVVMMHLRSLVQVMVDDALTPSGRRSRELLMRFSGLIDGGLPVESRFFSYGNEPDDAIPLPPNREALDADPVSAEVLSLLETALQANMGQLSEGLQLHDLQETESMVARDEVLESTSTPSGTVPESMAPDL